MNTHFLFRVGFVMVFSALLLLFSAFWALSQEGKLVLKMTGYLVIAEEEDGRLVERLLPLPETTTPGDIIQYNISGKNNSQESLFNVRAAGKVPRGTVYIDASNRSDIPADFYVSIDYGKSYAQPPLIIKVKKTDGSEKEEIVSPEAYTNISFTIKKLVAGETFFSSYRVQVR